MNLTELLTTLEAPIVVRSTRRMTQSELESYLDKAADILRGNADHSEFRGTFKILRGEFEYAIENLNIPQVSENAERARENLLRLGRFDYLDVE